MQEEQQYLLGKPIEDMLTDIYRESLEKKFENQTLK